METRGGHPRECPVKIKGMEEKERCRRDSGGFIVIILDSSERIYFCLKRGYRDGIVMMSI